MLKIKLYYDLPEYNPEVHDPDRVFMNFYFISMNPLTYAKWVHLKSLGIIKLESPYRGG